ncbi:hypothetical protein AB0Q95_32440 [Streptomyces sp. NPDC059900]|uniref:hypothetical protein n=1 Tax=Streptomyces sp. NPDC059900 TaxID=3155816 RepID=UPI003430570A
MDQHQIDEIAARITSAAAQFAPSHKPTPAQKADAASVLHGMLRGIETYGVTFADFDAIADFPRMAIQLVQRRDTRN